MIMEGPSAIVPGFKPGQILQARYQLERQLGDRPGRQTWLAHELDSAQHPQGQVWWLSF